MKTLGAAAVLLAIGLAYANHFQNAFHFDDTHTVVDNPYIRKLENIPRFFSDVRTFSILPRNRTYRPVISTSLAIDYWWAGGLKPAYFHASTFFWFVIQVVLLHALALRTYNAACPDPRNWWVALAAAAWFGLHPAMAETINYVIQRGDLYAALGVTAALWIYAAAPRLQKYGLYLIPFALAVLSKPPALIFPPILALYIWLFDLDAHPRAAGRALACALPAFLTAAALAYLTIAMTPREFHPAAASPSAFRITQPLVAARFLRTFLVPDHLSADTDLTAVASVWQDGAWGGFVLVAGLLLVVIACARRPAWRPVAFGVGWFLLAFLPAAVFPVYEVENDHRMFFPFLGLPLALCWPVAFWWYADPPATRRAVRYAVAALLLCELSILTFVTRQRNQVWRSEESLWRDVTRKSPRNGRGWMNYAVARAEKGDFPTALASLQRAKLLTPYAPRVELNLGVVEAAMHRPDAERHFLEGIRLGPDDSACRMFYGRWLGRNDRFPEAVAQFESVIAANPDVLDAYYGLMDVYIRQSRWREVRATANRALARIPGDLEAECYVVLAAMETEGAAHVPPTLRSPERFLRVSTLFYVANKFEQCIAAGREALLLRPKYAEAYNNMSAAFFRLEKWETAIQAARDALKIEPTYEPAQTNLARSLERWRRRD